MTVKEPVFLRPLSAQAKQVNIYPLATGVFKTGNGIIGFAFWKESCDFVLRDH
jgi:hypothetical protein